MTGNGRKPNVLILMTDQHRFDMMSCAGFADVPTPNIDRIASRGVRFNQAYCPSPSCAPSRNAILTGLYPHQSGVIGNKDTLDWRTRTMAHHFADNGYLTALIGKMHFNDAHKHGFVYHMSINDWLMYLGPKAALYADEIANHPLAPRYFDTVMDDGSGLPDVAELWETRSPWSGVVKPHDYTDMASKLAEADHLDAFVARECVRFMRRYKDEPFFLVAGFMKPHAPFFPPAAYAARYPVSAMSLPDAGDGSARPEHVRDRIRSHARLGEQRLKAFRAGYRGNLAFVDHCVGQVYDALEQLRLLDDTIVVYMSDHGEMDGEMGLYGKGVLYEPAVKVPLIVSYPGRLPQHRVSEALVSCIGLYATLAELTGTHHTLADADSIAPGFADCLHVPENRGADAVFAEWNAGLGRGSYMIRTHRYKYIHHAGGTHELFDLQADTREAVNLIADPAHASAAAKLEGRLKTWYDPGRHAGEHDAPHKEEST